MKRPILDRISDFVTSPQARAAASWSLVTATFLLLRAEIVPSIASLGLLLLALTSSLRLRRPFGYSASTSKIVAKARRGAAGFNHLLHRLPPIARRDREQRRHRLIAISLGILIALLFGIFTYEVDTLWIQFSLSMLIAGIIFGYSVWRRTVLLQVIAITGVYAMLILTPLRDFAVYIAVLFTLCILRLAWKQRNWTMFIPMLIGNAWLASLIAPNLNGCILVLTSLYGISAIFATKRREADERESARTALVLGFGLGLILLLQSYTAYAPLEIIFTLLCAGLAWKQHGQLSYAKYFFLIAVCSFLTVLALNVTSGWLVLAGLLTATSLLIAGVTLKSYTLRLAGLATLLGSVAVYIVEVLPVPQNYHENPILNRIGLGITFSLALPLLADWYQSLSLGSRESKLSKWIAGASAILAVLLLFAIILLAANDLLQSLLWIGLSILVLWVAVTRKLHLLILGGKAMLIASLAKLCLVDVVLLAPNLHLPVWIGSTIFLIIFLWSWPRLVGKFSL